MYLFTSQSFFEEDFIAASVHFLFYRTAHQSHLSFVIRLGETVNSAGNILQSENYIFPLSKVCE
jgi:hypothetical protein